MLVEYRFGRKIFIDLQADTPGVTCANLEEGVGVELLGITSKNGKT